MREPIKTVKKNRIEAGMLATKPEHYSPENHPDYVETSRTRALANVKQYVKEYRVWEWIRGWVNDGTFVGKDWDALKAEHDKICGYGPSKREITNEEGEKQRSTK